jgi:hypothetical protein
MTAARQGSTVPGARRMPPAAVMATISVMRGLASSARSRSVALNVGVRAAVCIGL